jgi:homocysteine S-methyltransferase
MTRVNPEYMGQLARTLSDRGAHLVGGCCEIHPAHVWEMNNYLNSRASWAPGTSLGGSADHQQPASPDEKRYNGPFTRKLLDGDFAVSVEMLPSRGTAPKLLQAKIDFIRELSASGLTDALDITDGSRGIPLIPPGDFIQLVRERLGWSVQAGDDLELIAHFTARDLNVMGLQARLVGYWVNRIRNAIFITGDPPKMAPTYPPSTGVFDLDSVDMIRLTHTHLNAGIDFGGQPLGKQPDPRTRFTIGTGFEPEALDGSRELDKLQRKLDAGADYVMTQPAFRWGPLEVLRTVRDAVPVLVGVLILRSLSHARRMSDVPGVVVPDAVMQRLGACDDPQDQARIGQDIAAEQIGHIRAAGWSGLYLMSPASHQPIVDVLRAGLS